VKHCEIKRPDNSYSEFYNYKGTYSIILFALVDADYRYFSLMWVVIVQLMMVQCSEIQCSIQQWKIICSIGLIISVTISDEAIPLSNTLLKPYSKVNLTLKQKIFNYRRSRGRRVSENAFGILAQRFCVFGRPIGLNVTTINIVIRSVCYLHNWLRMATSSYISKGCVD
jgi:hypothetical protein